MTLINERNMFQISILMKF